MSTESMVTQAKKRFHVEGQTSTLGARWQIWDGEQHFARFQNIADRTDADNLCDALNEGHRTAAQPEREAVLEAVRKVRDGYASQAKFADHEPASYFREFVQRLDAALTTPTPAVSRDEIVAVLEDVCAAAEYWAGCDEGCSHEAASDEIMSSGGSWPAQSYDKARAILSRIRGEGE